MATATSPKATALAAAQGAEIGALVTLTDGRTVKVVSIYTLGGPDSEDPSKIIVQWHVETAGQGGFIRLDRWIQIAPAVEATK